MAAKAPSLPDQNASWRARERRPMQLSNGDIDPRSPQPSCPRKGVGAVKVLRGGWVGGERHAPCRGCDVTWVPLYKGRDRSTDPH